MFFRTFSSVGSIEVGTAVSLTPILTEINITIVIYEAPILSSLKKVFRNIRKYYFLKLLLKIMKTIVNVLFFIE